MNILYIAASFPKPEDGATIYTDLAEELNKKHCILVIAPDQKIKIGTYKSNVERQIKVYRVGIFPYFNVGFIAKGISTISQSFFLKIAIRKILTNHQVDLLLYESPPTTNVNIISRLKKKYNCKTYLMLKDIFPQNAVDLNILKKNSLLYKFFRKKEKQLYVVSDIVGCMSIANMNYVCNNNVIDKNKIKYFPNTKKMIVDYDSSIRNNNVLKKYSILTDRKIILFGGNLGKPQYVELLIEIVNYFKNDNGVFFLFIGRGQEKVQLNNQIVLNGIKNAKIIDNLHRDEYESILPFVSIGLVTLNPEFTIPNFPSRILSYMEHSIPIFAATDKSTDLKDLLVKNNIGYWSYSGNSLEVVENLRKMIDSEDLEQIGQNSHHFAVTNFSVEKSVEYIENHYKELVNNVQK